MQADDERGKDWWDEKLKDGAKKGLVIVPRGADGNITANVEMLKQQPVVTCPRTSSEDKCFSCKVGGLKFGVYDVLVTDDAGNVQIAGRPLVSGLLVSSVSPSTGSLGGGTKLEVKGMLGVK